MGKGTVDWDSVPAWQRLVASIYATGVKIDLRAAAAYYGTTYDTLENRLRKIKKDAEALKSEADPNAVVTPSRSKSTASTPKK
ncbi:uncharacterized protein LTR77_008375 [Saxophila tyrrhenica]|uniref:HTH psq-type domain-containing protein n=1 Tax=Saxophila tyrrhenica TaxID=1690608 RepID=A0AAV9P0S0_9PEZI|nr:hypothetical protein LTR77_008375 [Saxophila tyrrhenica]